MKREDINTFITKNQKLTRKELAVKCGISVAAVGQREQNLGLKREWEHPSKITTADLKSDRAKMQKEAEGRAGKKKYKEALAELGALEKEFSALLDIRKSNQTHSILPSLGGTESEAVVVVCASDWHVEEEVKKSKVSGLNEYNLDIAQQRAHQFFQRAVKLTTKESQDIPINEMILFLGGDFFSGNIHEELLENCLLSPIDACLYAQELIQSGIQFILERTELKITVVCTCGNHSRITKKTHISTEQGNSLEYFMYNNLRSRFEGERCHFVIGDGYHVFLPVYNKILRFHHGHSLRYQGGIGGLTIPVNKAIGQWNKAKWADKDVFGHWHTYMPMSNFVGNGSMIGYNAFAVSIKADFERPQQAMFLVDKVRGFTFNFPILFDV